MQGDEAWSEGDGRKGAEEWGWVGSISFTRKKQKDPDCWSEKEHELPRAILAGSKKKEMQESHVLLSNREKVINAGGGLSESEH